MRKFRFYKASTGQWFIDLPEYIDGGGKRADLQMVEGADKMLELLAEGEDEVIVNISQGNERQFAAGCEYFLSREEIHSSEIGGASYKANIRVYEGPNSVEQFPVWLCNVTKFVFGDFPEVIYVRKINT